MAMASSVPSPRTFIAGEDLEAFRLVKLSGSTADTVVYADSGDRAIGVVQAKVSSGDKVSVELLAAARTLKVVAAGTITVNSVVYAANDGKVSDSVAGNALGVLLIAGAAGAYAEMLPYGQPGGNADTDLVIFMDDFGYYTDGDLWAQTHTDGGATAELDAHAGVITLAPSDTTVADNDESYIRSANEIFKPAVGAVNGEVLATFEARLKLTEANTDDANIGFGLTSSAAAANQLVDNGGGVADADQQIAIFKVDGGTVWQGTVRDTAHDTDTNIGAFSSGSFQKLKIVISDADITDGDLNVEFFVNGVSGGTKAYTFSSASEMRLWVGVKNGGANEETLHIDKIRAEFKR